MDDRRTDPPVGGLWSELAGVFGRSAADRSSAYEGGTEHDGAFPIHEWIESLDFLRSDHSSRIESRAKQLRCTFEVTELEPHGFIAANCKTHQGVYEVCFSLDLDDFIHDAICSCQPIDRTTLCVHTYCLATHLMKELRDPSSSLLARVKGEPAGQTAGDVLPAQPALVLRELDLFLASRPETETEPSESAEEYRLAWKFEVENDKLVLKPIRQRPRKRGGGWTKGNRVSLSNLLNSRELITSSADQKAQKAIRQEIEPGYYFGYSQRPKLSLDIVEAADALVGHDLVYFGDESVEVRRFAFGLQVLDTGEELILRLAFPDNTTRRVQMAVFSHGIVAYAADIPLVMVCRCDEEESDLAAKLIKGLRFPRQHLDELQKRLNRLSLQIPVQLPESMAGPIVPADATPVVLLRSREQGNLECGLRVKDGRDRLYPPGEGALLYPDTLDEKPVQYSRDAAEEAARARRIEKELRLDRAHEISPWNWRLLDFQDSLKLLEDLETKAEEMGFEAVWDPNSIDPIRIVGSITAQNVRVEVSKKRDWFGIEGGCKIGEHEFQLAELLSGIQSQPAEGYMQIRPGQWARITADFREKLLKLRDATNKNRKRLEISPTAAPIVRELEAEIDFAAPKAWRDCLARLDRSQELEPIPPASLSNVLRDYQLDGYRWLRRLAEWGVGGCLADDMGLGKTIQALAVLIDRQPKGPALVIAPTSVGFNWVRETERFAPELAAHLYRDTDRRGFLEQIGPGDVVICSYGLALRDAEGLGQVKWGTLILDEAQFVKNSRTKTSLAIQRFNADWKLALTGTPMENHLGELWSIFRNVSPGLFGSWDNFRERFASPIEKYQDAERQIALSRVIRPFVLRRTKSEVLTELPERSEMNLYVELSDEERIRYDEMRLAAIGEIEQIAGLPEIKEQRFRVLAMLTRLRQISCHVGLVDAAWKGTSAKLELLVQTLQELREQGHRALIFSQFTSYLALIRQALDATGVTYEYLDGSTSPKARQQRVDAFQTGGFDAFLISLKAGGTGLNLTAADYVIHMDPWWNPAVEDQATDRAHRMGQTRSVMVYRIVARGTIEEQILDLHHDKRDLVAGVMEGTQSAGRLKTDELVALIRGSSI